MFKPHDSLETEILFIEAISINRHEEDFFTDFENQKKNRVSKSQFVYTSIAQLNGLNTMD